MIHASPLGKAVTYVEQYDPTLLFPISRAQGRGEIGLVADTYDTLPFIGVDQWTAYELSWLNGQGKPMVAMATCVIPCMSPNLIESKSFKLYLNSFNQTIFADEHDVHQRLIADLSATAGAPVDVHMHGITSQPMPDLAAQPGCVCIDTTDLSHLTLRYQGPHADYLRITSHATSATPAALVHETLISHLLKSNCPVTGQPDWATLRISYHGLPMDHAGLLAYIISFRQHQGFHEQCVEQIFLDLWSQCAPMELSVYARYTRRGGLDINPYRASPGSAPLPPPGRSARQ